MKKLVFIIAMTLTSPAFADGSLENGQGVQKLICISKAGYALTADLTGQQLNTAELSLNGKVLVTAKYISPLESNDMWQSPHFNTTLPYPLFVLDGNHWSEVPDINKVYIVRMPNVDLRNSHFVALLNRQSIETSAQEVEMDCVLGRKLQ